MKIISCGNSNRFNVHKNHLCYSTKHKIDYEFYLNKNTINPYFLKIDCILDSFSTHDNVLYLDNDAFFYDFQWDCKNIFDCSDKLFFATKSPKTKFTSSPLFNSGVMFIKKSSKTIEYLKSCKELSDSYLKQNWRHKYYGRFLGNDQPRLIFNLDSYLKGQYELFDYPGFNARPEAFSFQQVYPIVHFAGPHKSKKIKKFQEKFNVKL